MRPHRRSKEITCPRIGIKSSLGRRHLLGSAERSTLFAPLLYSEGVSQEKRREEKENWNTSVCQCMWEKMEGGGTGGRSITECWDLILVYKYTPPPKKKKSGDERREKREGAGDIKIFPGPSCLCVYA